jgi:hypothetical protein
MAHRRGAVAIMALCLGVALASCAYQPNSSTPLSIQKDVVQPARLTAPPLQQGKKLTAVGSDSDCVLTTGELHLWCKWITRYY